MEIIKNKYVIIDTSAILFGFKYKNDVFESVKNSYPGYKILLSKGILRELEGIAQNKGKRGSYARIALASIKYKNVDIDINNENVDDWIVETAQKLNYVVITNDSELCRRLKRFNLNCLKLTKEGFLK